MRMKTCPTRGMHQVCIQFRVSFRGLPLQLPMELGHAESPHDLGDSWGELVTGFVSAGFKVLWATDKNQGYWGIKMKSSYHPRLEE